ncbi:MAG TPA: phospho-N-acetylmuramoyl-pentapeptide-transferase [Limnochordia bacterium]|nr:phospho-N-acetylmuramoyl-pentapeptide-transferase [Limnochordia bacterium]
MGEALFAGLVAATVAAALGPAVIGWLYRLKFGQQIRQVGPQSHLKKAGTPTMGGVLIFVALAVATLLFAGSSLVVPYILFTTLGYALIGFVDDWIKVKAKRSLGLKARQKLAAQVLVALVPALFALADPDLGNRILLPFTHQLVALPNWLFGLLAVGTIVGSANAVNETDGLDGLAAGAVAIAAFVYAIIALVHGAGPAHAYGLAVFAAALGGACLGFVWFNAHPAQVFMGDTGSLGLGAALGALAVFTQSELVLIIVGGLFVLEVLSVIVQVSYFRLTHGKRILKMSPLHHHFEQIGWAEPKIVIRFWLLALVFGIVGLYSVASV